MATYRNRFGPHNPQETYVEHGFAEQLVDLGEVEMNHVTVRALWTGTVAASCDHERMLRHVKVPVLLTHHFRAVDDTGLLMGAMSDIHAARVRELLAEAGVAVDYRSFDTMGHSMHGQDPGLFTDTLTDWASSV